MAEPNKSPEDPLQCPSLFENLEDLRWDDMISSIESDIFSKRLGSHDAVHFLFEKMQNNDTPLLIRQAINTVFSRPSLRQKIEKEWNLYPDYADAKRHQHEINKGAPYDLASWSIEHCPSCFNNLLDYDMIQPSSFSKTGYNFFWLALRSERHDLMERLVCLMDPQFLLEPFSVREAEKYRDTMFQISTWNRTWFAVCWARLRSSPHCRAGLASLGEREIENIFRHVDIGVANQLLEADLDIGEPFLGNASPVWLTIVHRVDPEPMLTWLLNRGHLPPPKFLIYAVTHKSIPTTKWIMHHVSLTEDWRDAICVAAEGTDCTSAQLMSIILRVSVPKLRTCPTMSQNMVIKIVNGVCQEKKSLDESSFPPNNAWKKTVEALERGAVQKIKSLGEVVGKVEVLGAKLAAEDAGFCQLSESLSLMGNEDILN
ncbi:hypothetical protein PMG11_11069 [Penicillium brasilianum]|uniref:Uncharacterized protein n=1 Tax=Penicillium brasilianum TaxID=104259 RepID=A0A0F7U580_PENBI|nr:hypothetical protein PMG11_11069 [Penicillium brasilianum]